MMKYVLGVGLCAVLLGSAFACGGSEKPSEAASTAGSSALSDFGRDIEQMASGVSDAQANFTDDLLDLSKGQPVRARVEELAAALGTAVKGRTILPEQRDALANAILAVAARGDVAKARADIEATLTAAGAPADAASAAGNAAARLFTR